MCFLFSLSWISNLLDPWLTERQQALQILGKLKRKAEYLEEYQGLNLLS